MSATPSGGIRITCSVLRTVRLGTSSPRYVCPCNVPQCQASKLLNGANPAHAPGRHLFCVLAQGSFDETIRLWETRTGLTLRTLPAHSEPVTSVAFSFDGTLLVSASYDGMARMWDVGTGAAFSEQRQRVSDIEGFACAMLLWFVIDVPDDMADDRVWIS